MASNWKNKVAQSFDQNSSHYDSECDIQMQIAQNLANDLPTQNVTSILEIGCGTGNLTKHLIELHPKATLHITDISPAMLEHAKQKYQNPNIQWECMDAESLTTSKQYDLIVANMAFQWLEDINQAIENITTRLSPNGKLYFTLPGSGSFTEWKETLNDLGYPAGILDFQLPQSVYRQDKIIKTYASTKDFLRSMKQIGAASPKKGYTPLSPAQLKSACAQCDQNHNGNITWNILYCMRTKHESV